jgi:hypothetical protein
MCPLCAMTAALTTAGATTATSAVVAWSFGRTQRIGARWRTIKSGLLQHLAVKSNPKGEARDEQ